MGAFGANLFSMAAVPVAPETTVPAATPFMPEAPDPNSDPGLADPDAADTAANSPVDAFEGGKEPESRRELAGIIGGSGGGPDQKGSLRPGSIALLETLHSEGRQWAERRIYAALPARPQGLKARFLDVLHGKEAELRTVRREVYLARSIENLVVKFKFPSADWKDELGEIKGQTPHSDWFDYPGLEKRVRFQFMWWLEHDVKCVVRLKSVFDGGFNLTDLIHSKVQMLMDANRGERSMQIMIHIFDIRDAFKDELDLRKFAGYEREVKGYFGEMLAYRKPEDGLSIPGDFPEVDLNGITEDVVHLLIFGSGDWSVNTIRPAQLDKVDRILKLYGDMPGVRKGIERAFLKLVESSSEQSQGIERFKGARTVRERYGKVVDFEPLINTSLLAALRGGDWLASQQIVNQLFEQGRNPAETVEGYEDAAREGLTGLFDRGSDVTKIIDFVKFCGKGADFSKIDPLERLRDGKIYRAENPSVRPMFNADSDPELITAMFNLFDKLGKQLMPPGFKMTSIPEFQDLVGDVFRARIFAEKIDGAALIEDRFGSEIDFRPSIEKVFLELLKSGLPNVASQVDEKWGEKFALRQLAGFEDAVRECYFLLLTATRSDAPWAALEDLKGNFVRGVNLVPMVQRVFCHFIERGDFPSDYCRAILEKIGKGVDLSSVAMLEKYLTGSSRRLFDLLAQSGRAGDFLKILPRYNYYLRKLWAGQASEDEREWNLNGEDVAFVDEYPLAEPFNLHKLRMKNDFSHGEFRKRPGDEKFRYLWEECKAAGVYMNILLKQRFEEGAAVFGYRAMFEYAGVLASGDRFHDHMFGFDDILKLYQMSGLRPNQFYGNILNQVRMDDGVYTEGAAYAHLNAVASALKDADFAGILEEAIKYPNIPELQELVQLYHEPSDVFQSWKHLKKFYELQQMLGRREILNQLLGLGDSPQARYVRTLLFHPGVDATKVLMLWRQTEQFLGLDATYTSSATHDRKKPSNYVHIPHLDLTAENMFDALVEGVLDRLQTWRPFTVEYRVSSDVRYPELSALSTQQLLSRAVGSRRMKVAGEAQDAAQLVRTMAGLFGVTEKGTAMRLVVDIIEGRKIFSAEDDLRVRNAVLFGKSGYGLESSVFRAKISLKSDPDAVVAGNDVVDCMPFGDGKSVLYTFNPVCGQLTVQKKNGDNKFRTVAQSLLTRDMFFGGDGETKTVSQIIAAMQDSRVHLADIMDERVLCQTRPHTLACDSVGKNKNFTDPELIKRIYQDFFHRYLRWKGQAGTFDQDKVVTSTTFNVLGPLPTEPNFYVPLAPMSYSDMAGDEVATLNVSTPAFSGAEVIPVEAQNHYMDKKPELKDPRLAYLTYEDTLPVTYIEGKAYSDNLSLVENLHNMENALIATGINNVAKDRPNMSLKYVDEKGFMRGYLLAYQGRFDPAYAGTNGAIAKGDDVIYVADIARLPGHDGAGIAMLYGFLEMYKREYLDRGNLIPVFAKFREGTSYRFITRMLPRLSRRLGFELEVVEIGGGKVGQDTMHWAVVRPVKGHSVARKASSGIGITSN